jgi:hypothetical protein
MQLGRLRSGPRSPDGWPDRRLPVVIDAAPITGYSTLNPLQHRRFRKSLGSLSVLGANLTDLRAVALQLVGLLVVVALIGRFIWWIAATIGLIALAVPWGLHERLYGASHLLNDAGQYLYYGRVGGCLITGNEDGVGGH